MSTTVPTEEARTRRRLALVFVALSVLMAVGVGVGFLIYSQQRTEPSYAPAGVLAGRVFDAEGRGTAVKLTATPARGQPHVGGSAADGAFELTDLPPGSYVLEARSDGEVARQAGIEVTADRGLAGIELRMERSAP